MDILCLGHKWQRFLFTQLHKVNRKLHPVVLLLLVETLTAPIALSADSGRKDLPDHAAGFISVKDSKSKAHIYVRFTVNNFHFLFLYIRCIGMSGTY